MAQGDNKAPRPRVIAGRYQVVELLGRGGMASVYRARDQRLNRDVAIKLLRPDLVSDTSVLQRFRREAHATAQLNHPSIVATYDFGEDPGVDADGRPSPVPFIVMECVEGKTVREILHSGDADPTNPAETATQAMQPTTGGAPPEADYETPQREGLSIDEAVMLTARILAALAYSHEKKIVHRDIKPGNVIVSDAGDVKVMDFGIARALTDPNATVTNSGGVLGTAQYISPEQANGTTADSRSDLYSTGCLLYELLTGRTPFVGDSIITIAYKQVHENPLPPSTFREDISEALDRVVMHALAKDMNERYQSAEEFRKELLAAHAGAVISAPEMSSYAPVADYASDELTPASKDSPYYSSGPTFKPVSAPHSGSYPALDVDLPIRDSRGKILGIVALVLVAVIIAAGAGTVIWSFANNTPATDRSHIATYSEVPDVVGMTEEQAKTTLEEAGFTFERGEDSFSKDPEGIAIATLPEAGHELQEGRLVQVSFSKGPESITIPDVVGWTDDSARTAMEAADLVVAGVTKVDGTNPEGTVVSVTPQPGTEVDPGTEVTIAVSSGRVVLPSLKGLTLLEARRVLNDTKLVASVVYEVTNNTAPDKVIKQSPDPGKVRPWTTVRITVAKAPKPVPTTVTTTTKTATKTPTPTTTTHTPTPTPTPTPTSTPTTPTTPNEPNPDPKPIVE